MKDGATLHCCDTRTETDTATTRRQERVGAVLRAARHTAPLCSCCGVSVVWCHGRVRPFSVCADLVCTLTFAGLREVAAAAPTSRRRQRAHHPRSSCSDLHERRSRGPETSCLPSDLHETHRSLCWFDRLRNFRSSRCSLGFPRRNSCTPNLLGDSAPSTEFFRRLDYLKLSSVLRCSPFCRHGGLVHKSITRETCNLQDISGIQPLGTTPQPLLPPTKEETLKRNTFCRDDNVADAIRDALNCHGASVAVA